MVSVRVSYLPIAAANLFLACGRSFPLLPGDSLLCSVGLFICRADFGHPDLKGECRGGMSGVESRRLRWEQGGL